MEIIGLHEWYRQEWQELEMMNYHGKGDFWEIIAADKAILFAMVKFVVAYFE